MRQQTSDAAGTVRVLRASPGQERLWLLADADGSTAPYTVPLGYRLDAPLDAGRLHTALAAVIARHDALRTGLRWSGNHLVQEVHDAVEPEVAHLDCARVEEFADRLGQAATEPFDLSRPPLFRAVHASIGDRATGLGFVFHHSVCDSWSLELFMRDVCVLLDGGEPDWEPGQHTEFSRSEHDWLGRPDADAALDYWRHRLGEGVPPLDIGHGRRVQPRTGRVRRFVVPAEVPDALARQTSTTRFAAMLAGYAALLRRYSTNERIGVGLPIAGRTTPRAEATLGYLSNTIVAIEGFTGQTTFRDSVRSAFRHVVEGLEHGRLPFQDIAGIAPAARNAGSPLYEAMFGPQNTPVEITPTVGDMPLVRVHAHNGTAKCDLTLLVDDTGEEMHCELEYDTAMFDDAWADRFRTAYTRLLTSAARNPDARVDELPLLDDTGQAFAARPDAADYRAEVPAHVHVERQAAATPDALAVTWSAGALTYRELDRCANAFAEVLRARDAGPGTRVGILLDRGPELICALLGTFKAGAAFVPLDSRFPAARISTICADAAISVLVATDPVADLTVISPDLHARSDRPATEVSGRDLAYIYYTSGSTGTPKGVLIDHRCVMIRLAYMRDAYAVPAGDAVLHKTPLIFDISIWEIFLPLFSGGTVVVAEPGRETDTGYLRGLLREHPIVLAHFVPSALAVYLDSVEEGGYPHLRWVIASGEAASTDLVRRAQEHFGTAVHVQYGQTETAEVTVWDGEDEPQSPAALLGRPVGAFSVHVVDPALRVVPPDVPGELCVSGKDGLAWGYQNRPALTAGRFVPLPDAGAPGDRLYRTGDVARVLGSGLIEYLGRVDHQLKIAGCRVEPGEIENVLRRHPRVSNCVVTVHRSEDSGPRLVAHVVVARGPVSPGELAEHARAHLPWYMLPSSYVFGTDFPRTMSGKIDRDRLPEPDHSGVPGADEPPVGPVEGQVAAEWSRVLGRPGIGRHDDFFHAGGSSLAVVRMLSGLGRRFRITLSTTEFMRRATVAALAATIQREVESVIDTLTDDEVSELLEVMHGNEPE